MKKKKPDIRFKGFEEEWEEKTIGDVAKLGSSKRVRMEDYVESGIPFFRGSEISKLGSSLKLEDVFFISEEYYFELKEKYGVPQIGDILLTAVGTLGNSFLVRDNTPFYFKDGNLIWLNGIQISSEYLNIYIGDGIGKKRVLESAAGSNQKALTMVKLQNVLISVPNKEEQTRIGTLFQNIDQLITLAQRKYDKLITIKKSLLEKMFPKEGTNVPEIRFKGFTGAWEERNWKDTVDISTNMVDPKSGRYDELLHIGPGNIESFTGQLLDNVLKVGESDLISGKFYFKKGDIIYGKIRPQLAKYLIASFEGLTSADAYVLNTKNGVVQNYLYVILQTADFYKYSVSVSARTGMPKINRDELNVYNYRAPNVSEQKKIGQYFQHLDTLLTLQQRKLEKLKNLKKAMLERMFV